MLTSIREHNARDLGGDHSLENLQHKPTEIAGSSDLATFHRHHEFLEAFLMDTTALRASVEDASGDMALALSYLLVAEARRVAGSHQRLMDVITRLQCLEGRWRIRSPTTGANPGSLEQTQATTFNRIDGLASPSAYINYDDTPLLSPRDGTQPLRRMSRLSTPSSVGAQLPSTYLENLSDTFSDPWKEHMKETPEHERPDNAHQPSTTQQQETFAPGDRSNQLPETDNVFGARDVQAEPSTQTSSVPSTTQQQQNCNPQ